MNTCETHQASLSALADGELETVDLLPTVDHLSDCADCRQFWQGTRALDQLLTSRGAQSIEEPLPPQGWDRIVAARTSRPASRAGWIAAAAVAAAIVFGLWPMSMSLQSPVGARTETQTAALEAGASTMTEQRFVQLLSEVLRADRRYHDELLSAVSQVRRADGGGEGRSADYRAPGESRSSSRRETADGPKLAVQPRL